MFSETNHEIGHSFLAPPNPSDPTTENTHGNRAVDPPTWHMTPSSAGTVGNFKRSDSSSSNATVLAPLLTPDHSSDECGRGGCSRSTSGAGIDLGQTSGKSSKQSGTESELPRSGPHSAVPPSSGSVYSGPFSSTSQSFSSDDFCIKPAPISQTLCGQAFQSTPVPQEFQHGHQYLIPLPSGPWGHQNQNQQHLHPTAGFYPGNPAPSATPSVARTDSSLSSATSRVQMPPHPNSSRAAHAPVRVFKNIHSAQPTRHGRYTPYQAYQSYQPYPQIAQSTVQPSTYGTAYTTTNQQSFGNHYTGGHLPYGPPPSGYQPMTGNPMGHGVYPMGQQQHLGYAGLYNPHSHFQPYIRTPIPYLPDPAPYANIPAHPHPQTAHGQAPGMNLFPGRHAPTPTLGHLQAPQWYYSSPAPFEGQAQNQAPNQVPGHDHIRDPPATTPPNPFPDSAPADREGPRSVHPSDPSSPTPNRKIPPRSEPVIPRKPVNKLLHQGPMPSFADVYPEDSSRPSSDHKESHGEQKQLEQNKDILSTRPGHSHSQPANLRRSPPIWPLPRSTDVQAPIAAPSERTLDPDDDASKMLHVPTSSANKKARQLGILSQLAPSMPGLAEGLHEDMDDQKTTPVKQHSNKTRRSRASLHSIRNVPAIPKADAQAHSSQRLSKRLRSNANNQKIQVQPSLDKSEPPRFKVNAKDFHVSRCEWPELPGSRGSPPPVSRQTVLSILESQDSGATPTASQTVTGGLQLHDVDHPSTESPAGPGPIARPSKQDDITPHAGPLNPVGHEQSLVPPGFDTSLTLIDGVSTHNRIPSPNITYLRCSDLFLDEVTGESPPYIPLSHDQVDVRRSGSPTLPGVFASSPSPLTQDQIDGSKYGLAPMMHGLGSGSLWNLPVLSLDLDDDFFWGDGWNLGIEAGF